MTDIIITGVGGQGAVLLSNILGVACAKKGINLKTAELHGLSQRSGSIVTHLRMGENIISPLIPAGSADIIASLELTESLRYIEFLKPGGTIVSSSRIIHPPAETIDVSSKKRKYVKSEEILEALSEMADDIKLFDGKGLAESAGDFRTENVVLLGALFSTGKLPLNEQEMIKVIKETVPTKAVESNLNAFQLGKEITSNGEEE